MNYDTQVVRSIARKVEGEAERVRDIGGRGITEVMQPLNGTFQGRAADSLNAKLEELRTGLAELRKGLSDVGEEVRQFARRLDEADQQAMQHIQRK